MKDTKTENMIGIKSGKLDNYSAYTIYSDGTVVSQKRGNIKVCRAKMDKTLDDYVRITIKGDDGSKLQTTVHRLVWLVFKGEIPKGYDINHKNEIKTDNRLENLECISHADNMRYGKRMQKARETYKRRKALGYYDPHTRKRIK